MPAWPALYHRVISPTLACLLKIITIIVYLYVSMIKVCGRLWRSEDNLVRLVLYFHLCVGFGNYTHVTRLVQEALLLGGLSLGKDSGQAPGRDGENNEEITLSENTRVTRGCPKS